MSLLVARDITATERGDRGALRTESRAHVCPRPSSRVLTQSDKRQDSGDDDNCADDIHDAVHLFPFRAGLESNRV